MVSQEQGVCGHALIAAGGTGLEGSTQFGAPSAIAAQSQDGYTSGNLAGVKVDGDGIVQDRHESKVF
mgnify:CR=1 FL=1